MANPHNWSGCRRDLVRSAQIFPQLEATPDLTRGEQRLAAEVALAELHAWHVPTWVHERAVDALAVMAKG